MRLRYFLFLFLPPFISTGQVTEKRPNYALTTLQQPEAISLFGKPLYRIELSPQTKAQLDSSYAVAKANYDKDPNNADNIIWLGRRTAYLWRYREAIDIFTEGIKKFPNDPRMYRHRGHRYITIREFDKAIADLNKAVDLIKGKPDEVEPDGQPNKYNIPTSTLHTNIWYHLGLAYYLKGNFLAALTAFRACRAFSKNDDMLCAASDWEYMSKRRSGREPIVRSAQELLEPIKKEMNIIENFAYHRRLLMYKGELPPDSLLNLQNASNLDIVTYGYGVGNWYSYNGQVEKAKEIFEKVIAGNYWAAFGYLAAEADLKRMQSTKNTK